MIDTVPQFHDQERAFLAQLEQLKAKEDEYCAKQMKNVEETCGLIRNGSTLINQEFQVLDKIREIETNEQSTLKDIKDVHKILGDNTVSVSANLRQLEHINGKLNSTLDTTKNVLDDAAELVRQEQNLMGTVSKFKADNERLVKMMTEAHVTGSQMASHIASLHTTQSHLLKQEEHYLAAIKTSGDSALAVLEAVKSVKTKEDDSLKTVLAVIDKQRETLDVLSNTLRTENTILASMSEIQRAESDNFGELSRLVVQQNATSQTLKLVHDQELKSLDDLKNALEASTKLCTGIADSSKTGFKLLDKTLREVQEKEDGHHAQVKWQLLEFGNLNSQLINNSSVHTQQCMDHLKAIILRHQGGGGGSS